MKTLILKFARHFLAIGISTLTLLGAAQAIVVLRGVPSAVVESGLKAQLQKYRQEYGAETTLKHFGFYFHQDAQEAFQELAQAQVAAGRGQDLALIVNEFQKMQLDLLLRGFEPSTENYFAPKQRLVIFYNAREKAGPEVEENLGKKVYSHSFNFELRLSYQTKDKKLSSGDRYPQLTLSGSTYLRCLKEAEDCLIITSSVDKASISWDTLPGPRGGNSSAGGGSVPVDERTTNPFLDTDKAQEILKDFSSEKKELMRPDLRELLLKRIKGPLAPK